VQAVRAARRVPWSKVLATIVGLNAEGCTYWNRLSPEERKEVLELATESTGTRANLSAAEQGRLVGLFAKIRKGT